MSGPLSSLKHLPCPAGEKCTAFQCLFNHDQDRNHAEQKSTSKPEEHHQAIENTPLAGEDGPRKRLKLTQDASPVSTDFSKQEGQDGNGHRNVASQVKSSNSSSQRRPDTASEPISTPLITKHTQISVRRLEQETASSSQTKTGASPAKTSLSLASTVKTPDVLKTSAKAAPKKPETLNPRLLKKSPAQHEMRLKLVKALHDQYSRLNNELKKDPNNKEPKLVLSEQELIVRVLDSTLR